MKLYHITKYKFLNSILQKGLLININFTSFVKQNHIEHYYDKYSMQPIFLTTDYEYIIKTQLTKSFIKNNKLCLLKIFKDIRDLEGEYDYLNITTEKDYQNHKKSFISKKNIEPKDIKFIKLLIG